MDVIKKSSSIEQQEAEDYIFPIVEAMLEIKLEKNKKIFLANNAFTYMQPDFYSEECAIVGEIFAHIGKPKKAQDNKISNDILKMLLLEKVQNRVYRKIIVVCDEFEEQMLRGKSVLAESIRQFGIEVVRIDVSEELRNKLLLAQDRQRMVNA